MDQRGYKIAVIDISMFASHSSRGASISEATRRGASPNKFYNRGIGLTLVPTKGSTIGKWMRPLLLD